MSQTSRMIMGAIVGVIGLIALFLASRATDDVMYYTGIIVFLVTLLFNYAQVKRYYDHQPSH